MTFRDELKKKYPKTFAAMERGAPLAAVKLHCLECVGGLKQDVRDCTDKGCPLYQVRPYKTDSEVKAAAPRTPAQVEAARQAGERLRARAEARRSSCVSPLESRPGKVEGSGEGQDSGDAA